MNPDHIAYYEWFNLPVEKKTIRACYRIERKAVASAGDMELVYDEIKAELVKEIQKEMIKDLSGYFKDESFDEKDVEYITTISHGQLEKAKREVLQEWHGDGDVRRFNLGRWYQIIQDTVNGHLYRQDQYFRRRLQQTERDLLL